MSKQRPIYKKVGARIKARRKAEFISQAVLANYANISQSYMSQIERGEKGFPFDLLHIICLYLHISMSDLLKDL